MGSSGGGTGAGGLSAVAAMADVAAALGEELRVVDLDVDGAAVAMRLHGGAVVVALV